VSPLPQSTLTPNPYAGDDEASAFLADGFWQFEHLKQSLFRHVYDANDGYADLRGKTFTVEVSENGDIVTVTTV
jgi:hypothetical protein